MQKFNKQEAEHEIKTMGLTHKFAMKMALMICFSVVLIISIAGIFFGTRTPLAIGLLCAIAAVFGIIAFSVTRSACL